MVTIFEKEGATIITVEKPSYEEREMIKEARRIADPNHIPKKPQKVQINWGMFKCNKEYVEEQERKAKEMQNIIGNLEDFTEILPLDYE